MTEVSKQCKAFGHYFYLDVYIISVYHHAQYR